MARPDPALIIRERWVAVSRCATAPFVLVALVLAASGCGRMDRARDCQAIAQVVNPALDEIESTARTGPETSAKYRAVSTRYAELARTLSRLEVRDARVRALLPQYTKLIERAARTAGRLADAQGTQQEPSVRAFAHELRMLADRHRQTSEQIDRVCLEP